MDQTQIPIGWDVIEAGVEAPVTAVRTAEDDLRALWTGLGVAEVDQDRLIALVAVRAQMGACACLATAGEG